MGVINIFLTLPLPDTQLPSEIQIRMKYGGDCDRGGLEWVVGGERYDSGNYSQVVRHCVRLEYYLRK